MAFLTDMIYNRCGILFEGLQKNGRTLPICVECEEQMIKSRHYNFFKGFDDSDTDGKLKFLAEKIYKLTT